MAANDDSADKARANRKSYAQGYMRGLADFFDLLVEHGPFRLSDLYDHCAAHYDKLAEWQDGDDDGDPPSLPLFKKP